MSSPHLRKHRSQRRGVSELIATLLLIAMVVVAAIVLFAFVTGLFSNLAKGGPSALVSASGEMTVPGSTSLSAILTLNLRNEGSQPIQSISATCANPPFSSTNCNNIVMDYGSGPVSPANPLPINALGSGSGLVLPTTAFTAGTTYLVELTVTFVGGSVQIVAVSIGSSS